MRLRLHVLLLALLFAIGSSAAYAQSNQFRDSRAHLGIAGGLFTYHGPIDLLQPRNAVNFVRENDPAAVLLGSFPIVGDRFYFRGLVGLTNFSTSDGDRLLAGISPAPNRNEFLTNTLLLFEPDLVMTLAPGSRSRILPYIFTGFGGMVAGPGKTNSSIDIPGTGVPGPERSSYYIPVGFGVDVAITGCHSIFGEASWRFDLNYVWRNESNYDPHNTSLIWGGLRLCLNRKKVTPPPPPQIPAPLAIPAYAPPLPSSPEICRLVELNSVYFAYGSTELDRDARRLLDENIEALRINPMCCVEILGYTDREDDTSVNALRMSRERAEAVFRYYVAAGLPSDRFTVTAQGLGAPCGKEEEGPGCPRNRRVDSLPYDCGSLLR